MIEKDIALSAEQTSDEIIVLFEKYGSEDYDGEPISQTSHMIQCAMLAMVEEEVELTIGAFLHDIGHLLKHEQETEAMGTFGVVNHEGIGAEYLRQRGFSRKICAIVANHVAAKRFLVATNKLYASKLSPASQETLKWQGGPMTDKEANSFKNHPYFKDIIKVRLWDEKAKDTTIALLPVSFFKNLIYNYLNQQN